MLLTTPTDFEFLWNYTLVSNINDYEKSGLKMIDLETMVTSLRLAWLKRIFSENDGTWKIYLHHVLKCYGGSFLFHCNYNVKDLAISSKFYTELLQWWAKFRDEFTAEKPWQNILWNNKDIRIDDNQYFKDYF